MATGLTRVRGTRATHNHPKMGPDFNAGGRTGAPPYLNTPEPSAWISAPRRGNPPLKRPTTTRPRRQQEAS